MPRIEDIGVFNSVREYGMAKLLRTCLASRSEWARVAAAMEPRRSTTLFFEAIENSGTSLYLTTVGCFGACCEEPLVNVHIPGSPMLILRRVQANHARQIVHDIAAGRVSPELVYCKVEEWDP